MTPLRLSYAWYRRLYVAVFLGSMVYAGLFGWGMTSDTLPESLSVDIIPVALAGLAMVGSIVGFILAKRITSFLPGYAVYLFFTLATAFALIATGGMTSPFIAVWVLIAFTAPVFGAYAWLPVLVLTGSYAASLYLNGALSTLNSALLVLSTLVPFAAGLILWRTSSKSEEVTSKNVKNLANQLSEVATKSEIVINAIGDGVIAVDGKGVIQLINPAGQEILGWGKQDALMLNYKSVLKLADENNTELDAARDPIQQVLNTNQQARANKLVALSKSGKKVSVSIVVSPIGDPGSGVIAVFRDVTKERAEEREQAEFISTASHEMRTPVASIEGYLGLALNPNTAQIDDRARGFILKAHEAAQHLGRLFQDLLDVSKSEDGRLTNTPRVVDMVTYTGTIAEGLQAKAAEKGLKLTFKPKDADAQKKIMPVYFVNQDNDHIREIIDNLIENAIKYTPQGEVTVDVDGTEDKVVVSFKDTGLGIPTEDLPHLFQKFYRVDNADRQQIGGTGLGLYLSRRLAEAMQGRLWVESVFGQGSTFFLELPRLDSQEAQRLKVQQVKADTQAAAAATAQSTPAIQPQIPNPQPLAVNPQPPTPNVKPATTVPRGEALSREQIAERARQLEELARQQRQQPPGRA